MDMDFSPEDLAFRDEVRAFLKESLPEHLKDGARRTPGVLWSRTSGWNGTAS